MENKIFEEALDYLAGSYMTSPDLALEVVLSIHPSDEQLDAFSEYLKDQDCAKCEVCGWWTHPGEGNLCSDCCNELENSDEYLNENDN